MSLFISNKNQTLLYDMIHKTPEIHKMFSTVDAKNQWFRKIIEEFYKKLPQTIDREMLKRVNRDTLGYMVNSLKQPVIHIEEKPITSLKKEQPIEPKEYTSLKKEQPIEPKEYTSFFDIPKPKVIDFSEQLNDEIITNMDELIEQQKKMRERELQEYAPPPPVPSQNIKNESTPRITILEELPRQEKHVHFSIPSMDDRMAAIEKKIDGLMEMFSTFCLRPMNNNPENISIHEIENHSVNKIKQMIQENV